MNQKDKYQPKTNQQFQRWLNKWYPEENHIRDRYYELQREWWPLKYTWIILAIVGGTVVGALAIGLIWPEPVNILTIEWFLRVTIFCGIILTGVSSIYFVPHWFDQRSEKPTPPRNKKD